jgi:hypothetical protein
MFTMHASSVVFDNAACMKCNWSLLALICVLELSGCDLDDLGISALVTFQFLRHNFEAFQLRIHMSCESRDEAMA